MRRAGLLIASLLVLAFPAAAAAADGDATLVACDRSDRTADFEGRMEQVAGADQLKMRFTLQARRPGRRSFRRVAAPGFGPWTASEPGTTRYIYTRRVEQLIGPAWYRVVIRFRWVDASGRTVARDHATSRSCRQRDTRPNLTIEELTAKPTADPSLRRYSVLVHNDGRGDAEPFELAVAGLDPVIVDGLGAHSEQLVEVLGPACGPGAPISAVADPGDLVDERSERDNELATTC
jgi:hypothetical protein